MGKTLDNVYKHQSLVYKYFLYVVSVALIVFFFPKGGQFKYEFQKGKPWQYENYYAPFNFSIQKSKDEIEKDKQQIIATSKQFYNYDEQTVVEVKNNVTQKVAEALLNSN